MKTIETLAKEVKTLKQRYKYRIGRFMVLRVQSKAVPSIKVFNLGLKVVRAGASLISSDILFCGAQ